MSLYAIDPGMEQSALISIGPDGIVSGHIWPNHELLSAMRTGARPLPAHLVVEQVESYGMPVGREVFDTVFWAGRFVEAWNCANSLRTSWSLLPRKAVKLALCGSLKAKDANIRQALIDRYGGPQCVRKGGSLAGIKSHLWAALALAVTYQDQQHSRLQDAIDFPEVTKA